MVEEPLERLNYFNGQRLEAADFRLEQAYHIRVRRWLNRALHSPGIAEGLEVTVKAGDAHTVVVAPGLALDDQGRELILLEQREVQVVGVPSPTEGVVFGNYLIMQYAEDLLARVEDGCAVQAGANGCGPRELTWGGPTRVRLAPDLRWQDTWPQPGSGQVVLAQAELDTSCAVRRINLGVRKYTNPTQSGRTRAYALEGEKDIDSANSKLLTFHIRGGRPDTVVLYLRGALFSRLYYTELGQHGHAVNLTTAGDGSAVGHTHSIDLGTLQTTEAGEHRHEVYADTDDTETGSIDTGDSGPTDRRLTGEGGVKGGAGNMEVRPQGTHAHTLAGGQVTTSNAGGTSSHTHSINGATQSAGVSPAARGGNAYTYVSDLRVLIDNSDFTSAITSRLGWPQLGDGTAGHQLVKQGTPPIPLELLGADLNEGPHTIELRVASGGGKILYNLYVE